MAKKRRLRAKNRMGIVVPFDVAAQDVTMNNGENAEEAIQRIRAAIQEMGIAEGLLDDVTVDGTNLIMVFNTSEGQKSVTIPIGDIFGAIRSIDDIYSNGDGTVIIEMTNGDKYTINLLHEHEGMAKLLILNSAAALPSTPANDTIYAIKNSGGTEIETLVIGGLQFAGGGGTPDNTPRLISPMSGSKIDFNGSSTTQVFVRGVNLGVALIIETTGDVTANVQTISVSDAESGVNVTLTKGSNFDAGTLVIRSAEIETRTLNIVDQQSWRVVDLTDAQNQVDAWIGSNGEWSRSTAGVEQRCYMIDATNLTKVRITANSEKSAFFLFLKSVPNFPNTNVYASYLCSPDTTRRQQTAGTTETYDMTQLNDPCVAIMIGLTSNGPSQSMIWAPTKVEVQ